MNYFIGFFDKGLLKFNIYLDITALIVKFDHKLNQINFMKKFTLFMLSLFFVTSAVIAQEQTEKKTQQGHTDQNKFRQMKDLLATPNDQHTASGAPGHQYSQQKVDYVMELLLDEKNNKIYGDENITYHNNSKDNLEYLWVQLDQNMRADDSKTPLATSTGAAAFLTPDNFKSTYMKESKGFGFI